MTTLILWTNLFLQAHSTRKELLEPLLNRLNAVNLASLSRSISGNSPDLSAPARIHRSEKVPFLIGHLLIIKYWSLQLCVHLLSTAVVYTSVEVHRAQFLWCVCSSLKRRPSTIPVAAATEIWSQRRLSNRRFSEVGHDEPPEFGIFQYNSVLYTNVHKIKRTHSYGFKDNI